MQRDENIDTVLMHITAFPELKSDMKDKSGEKNSTSLFILKNANETKQKSESNQFVHKYILQNKFN